MAAEVSRSSLVRVLSGHVEERPQIHAGNSDIFITKDLLGSLSKAGSATEEMALPLKTQRCSSAPNSSSASPSPSPDGKNKNQLPNSFSDSKLQDLNFSPINLFEDVTSQDLNLKSSTPNHYQSVCTLDKVRHALERAEKETMKKRSSSPPTAASLLAATSSLTSGVFAAACPGCLLYIIASKTDPRCPRCNSFVPPTLTLKKPKIDLNASF